MDRILSLEKVTSYRNSRTAEQETSGGKRFAKATRQLHQHTRHKKICWFISQNVFKNVHWAWWPLKLHISYREVDPESDFFKQNLDFNHSFSIDLAPNWIPVGAN